MGYYTTLSGGWHIEPPLKWSEIEPNIALTEQARRTVWLDLETEEVPHEEGKLITTVCHVVKVCEDGCKAYDTEQEVREIATAFPNHKFIGYLEGNGEENGDMWRMFIVDGKAIKQTITAMWPEAPEGAQVERWQKV